jgi:hypothetical protein
MVLTKWSQTFDRNLGKAFSLQIEEFDFLSSFQLNLVAVTTLLKAQACIIITIGIIVIDNPENVYPDVAALKMNIAYACVAHLSHANHHQHHHQVVYREALHVYATAGGTAARASALRCLKYTQSR